MYWEFDNKMKNIKKGIVHIDKEVKDGRLQNSIIKKHFLIVKGMIKEIDVNKKIFEFILRVEVDI